MKIKKVIRFRLSEIEKWIDNGGKDCSGSLADDREGDLFTDVEAVEAGDQEAVKA